MKKDIRDFLENWPKSFIKDSDLDMFLGKTSAARYSLVTRAIKVGDLVRVRRGLYLIGSKIKRSVPDEFELSLLVYGPSFISLESALSYHGWIPESVYAITSVSTKRAREFKTPVGLFNYKHVPAEGFYVGVERITTNDESIFVASPWRALADLIYVRRKSWESIIDIEEDLRIDNETILGSDRKSLKLLAEKYSSRRVRESLKMFLKEIEKVMQGKS